MNLSIKNYLKDCKMVEINEAAIEDLVDFNDIKIEGKNNEDRLESLLEQIKNPYLYRTGNTIVKISFSGKNVSVSERLHHYFIALKEQQSSIK